MISCFAHGSACQLLKLCDATAARFPPDVHDSSTSQQDRQLGATGSCCTRLNPKGEYVMHGVDKAQAVARYSLLLGQDLSLVVFPAIKRQHDE